ncbi:DegT/DnrJ/EryC1/StrS family aminotransferase [Caballeronia sp. LZ034LL]|uniref:DegT/DnrJ/EryC1/StrS family aminotransferase n=1 Tax=Caballeronia sp. LZ034LL TaxID=3038567 RepID=UPI0028572D21|nr:DegT/DnrJ/EryC1/StrS family aminotransferase [Caballeronia sp. LZ034LL]MDR5834613.1 DegT/DnrJ/EryC1/StrS family aminotransferase [Caballeronia sp. LZ034LL]
MTQPIPLFSMQAANAGVDVLEPIRKVIESHWYVLGREVADFESEFARYLGIDHCVGVANGTDALEIALRAVGVGPGDPVITCANAGFYSSTAVRAIGAIPVYIDIDPATMTLSPARLEEALTHVPARAIVATHLYGRLADIESLAEIAAARAVPLLEDCAQAHGATRGGRKAGTFGTISAFSFYPTKNLGAAGDGGAIACRDAALAQRVKQLRQYGWGAKYKVELAGGRNSRLDELQAAILRAKLPFLDQWNQARRTIARHYNAAFAGLPVQLPACDGDDHVAHLYVLRTRERDALRQYLEGQGIASEIHYPIPDHLQPVAAGGAPPFALPETEAACASVVTLPCFPGLTDEQAERVAQAVRRFFQREESR